MLQIKKIKKFGEKNNDKDPKFQVGDYVRISKYKHIFVKVYKFNQKKN